MSRILARKTTEAISKAAVNTNIKKTLYFFKQPLAECNDLT